MFREICISASVVLGAAACEPMEILWTEDARDETDGQSAEPNMPTAGSSQIPTKDACENVFDSYGVSFVFVDHPKIPQAVRLFNLWNGVALVGGIEIPNYSDVSGTGDLLTSCVVGVALVKTVYDLHLRGYDITGVIHGGSYKDGDTVPGTGYLSEHDNATAVDIMGVKIGAFTYLVSPSTYSKPIISTLRQSLGAFFEVVLDQDNGGPEHDDHFHAARPISALIGTPLQGGNGSSVDPLGFGPCALSITQPHAGQTLTVGDQYQVCFAASGGCGASLQVHLYKGDILDVVIAAAWQISAGSCLSFVPTAGMIGQRKIGISTADNKWYTFSGAFTVKQKEETTKLKLCEPFHPTVNVSCGFGAICYVGHKGNDYDAAKGTLVYAPASGTVTGLDKSVTGQVCTKNANDYYSPGNFVKISQGDYDVLIFHLTQGIPSAVKLDSNIKAGTPVGYVGNTGYTKTLNKDGEWECGIGGGYHLHFEVRKNNVAFDPYNSTDVEWVSCTYNDLGIAGFKDEEDDESPQNNSPQDQDGDGFADDTDCDDWDPGVFPNAKEYCNGIDDNCDGKVDENFPAVGTECYDGYGACKVTGVYLCESKGISQICSASAKAPKPEICGNSTDDDCDDEIDEGCGSVPPASSSNELEITVKAGKTIPAIDFSFCYDPGITDPKDCYQWKQSVKTVFSGDSITWKMDVNGGATRFNSTLFRDESDVQDGKTKPGSGDAWLCEGSGANANLTLQVTAKLNGKDISDKVQPVSYGSGCSGGIGLSGL